MLTAKGNVDTTPSESHKTLEKEVERMLEWEEGVELWNTALQVRRCDYRTLECAAALITCLRATEDEAHQRFIMD